MKDDKISQVKGWYHFLERKHSIYISVAFIGPYNELLFRETGTMFESQIHVKKGTSVFYLRSESERDSVIEHLSKFILDSDNDEIINQWVESGFKYNHWADTQIEKYNTISDSDIQDVGRWKEFDKNFQELLLFSTILPYWAMNCADHVLNSGDDTKKSRAQEIIAKFEPLRGDTRYPQVVEGVVKKYWEYFAKELNENIETMKLLLPSEIETMLQNPKIIKDIDQLEDRTNCIFGILQNQPFFFSFSQNEIDQLLPAEDIDVKEINGMTANPGKATGPAKIVNTVDDMSKVNKGDVIVSINTSPSIMVAIKKAVAIVTDDGGIMCHAAIVSREMKKPCVIGTKIATQVFKDGDLVEVDADNGVVRILEK